MGLTYPSFEYGILFDYAPYYSPYEITCEDLQNPDIAGIGVNTFISMSCYLADIAGRLYFLS